MKCSIQPGFASLDRTFHLSPHENICAIALITIRYLYSMNHMKLHMRVPIHCKVPPPPRVNVALPRHKADIRVMLSIKEERPTRNNN